MVVAPNRTFVSRIRAHPGTIVGSAGGWIVAGMLVPQPVWAAACDEFHGKELQSCLRASYPAQFATVEAKCERRDKGAERWSCRRDEYAALGLVIDPPVLRPDTTLGAASEVAADSPDARADAVPSTDADLVMKPESAAEPELIVDSPKRTPVLDALSAASGFLAAAASVCDNHEPAPLALDLWVSNPQEVAAEEKGQLTVAIGNAAAYFGMIDSVDSQVYDTIVARAQASFAANGIDAVVSRERRSLGRSTAHSWSRGNAETVTLPPGNYELISILVTDAISVACQEKGDAIGLVVQAGASSVVVDKVRETAERKILKQLSKNGAEAYILGPP